MAHRVGYTIVKCALLAAVFTLPQSIHHTDPPAATVGISVVLCSLAFILLQGSDPGYLTDELLRKAMDAEEEEGHLLPTEDEDDDDGDDLDTDNSIELRSPAKHHERKYRVKRVQQIQQALRHTKREADEAKEDEEEDDQALMETVDLEAQGTKASATRGESSDDDAIQSFCPDCSLFPPLRSRHCRMCGKCVATFDHHCFLLGTCIGEKNHFRFWWFLLFQSIELALAILVVVTRLQPATAKYTWTHTNGWSILLLGCLGLLLVLVGSMLGFHTFLAMGAMTTYEFGRSGSDSKLPYLRGFRECDLPFSRGLFRNLWLFCCLQRTQLWTPSDSTASSSSSSTPSSSSSLPSKRHLHSDSGWRPMLWRAPTPVDRDSDKICENIWENKYYSCC